MVAPSVAALFGESEMRIRVLYRVACPLGNFAPGAIIDVPGLEASLWVNARIAEYVRQEITETTAIEPDAERAVMPKPQKRRGRREKT